MSRLAFVILANPEHKLPMPGTITRQMFPADGSLVNLDEPFWIAALQDGSVKLAPPATFPGSPLAEPVRPAASPAAPASAATLKGD